MKNKPTVYILCGLTGAGKSYYARKLKKPGITILSIDQAIYDKYGFYGVDYPKEKLFEFVNERRPVLKKQMIALIKNGKNVVLDYGFWKKQKRDDYKKFIEENGGTWKLIYLKVPRNILLERLKRRNKNTGPQAIPVTEKDLDDFINQFEEPKNEGEIIITI